jgi:anti-sigma regulatory factor (Ser/Thr protein kinase)
VSLSRQRRFPRAGISVRLAREFTIDTLTEWGVADRQDDIRLCVSELVTNALLHAVAAGPEISVRLTTDGPSVRLEVCDSGGGHPEVLSPGSDQCNGRGLLLAQELSDDCGVTGHVTGKTVWLTFKIASVPLRNP